MERQVVSHSEHTGLRPHYLVWASVNGEEETTYAIESPEEGAKLIDELAREQLQDPNVIWNAFGLQVLEDDGEYHEWYNERCDAITEAFEQVS